MIEPTFQKYNGFKKWRWDAQDMLARVKNRTSKFDYKKSKKIASKLKNTYTNVFVLEPAFQNFFQIKKIPLYAQVMAKKPHVGQKSTRKENKSNWDPNLEIQE